MKICVFGAASNDINQIYIAASEKLGREMAKRGHTLVYGAGATGLMGGVSRGVHEKGGKVIGVAPKYFDTPGILYKGCDELIFTDTIRERKQIMEDSSDAFIMTPGGIGTYEEFFEILTLANLGRHSKPIAILNVEGYYNWVEDLMDNSVREGFVSKNVYGTFNVFTDETELLKFLENNVK